jgi:hypothetical protein
VSATYILSMQESTTGQVHGRTITLDREVPELEGQRVRVVLEPVADTNATLAPDTQARLWREWIERGPQGPIADDGNDEFP